MTKAASHRRQKRLSKKRWRKRLKRKRNKKESIYRDANNRFISIHRARHDNAARERFKPEFDNLFDFNTPAKELNKSELDVKIEFGPYFHLERKYEQTMFTLSKVRQVIGSDQFSSVTLDMEKVKEADFAAIFLLNTILRANFTRLRRLNSRLLNKLPLTQVFLNHPKNLEVCSKLMAQELIPPNNYSERSFLRPKSAMKLNIGRAGNTSSARTRQRSYAENQKGAIATRLRRYVNDLCLKQVDYQLASSGETHFDQILNEIIDNVQEHSKFSEYYVFANFFEGKKSKTSDEVVGELNIGVLNYGQTIYQGFEDSKHQNKEAYLEYSETVHELIKSAKHLKLTEENCFCYLALQPGVSRLKFQDENRGSGTISFIRSFLEFGDYESHIQGFHPRVVIFSGNTQIKCDTKVRPRLDNNGNEFLPLNNSPEPSFIPDREYLRNNSLSFPGTLIAVKLYLNRSHLDKKFGNS